MKLKLIDGEPVCHTDCEHYTEPHWCNAKYPPEKVKYQFDPPCIHGVRQQRDAAKRNYDDLWKRHRSLIDYIREEREPNADG